MWRAALVIVSAALCLSPLASAYVQFPIGPAGLINYEQAGRSLAAATSLSNGLKSLLGRAADEGGSGLLGVNITSDWGHDAYKSRLLADAVESYIYLYTPAIAVASGRNWPLGPDFIHTQTLASPAGRGTAPNWDTVYSVSRAELSLGAFELRWPVLKDRFYSVVIYDAYQNVIVSLGSGQHVTDGGSILLLGPTTAREPAAAYRLQQLAAGARAVTGGAPYSEVVEFPTDIALVLLRVVLKNQTASPDADDLAAVKAFQAGTSLKPYRFTPPANASTLFARAPGGVPALQQLSVDPAAWYGWATNAVQQYPAPPTTLSEPIAGKLRRFGLLEPGFNYSALPAEQQAALALAVRVGNRLLDAGTLYGFEYEWASGWQVTTRGWGVYGHDYFTNAVVVKSFILPNTGVDAVYGVAYFDSDRTPLDGNNNTYTWTIPAGKLPYDTSLGWWSFIVYDGNATLVENPLQRYGVGDRTKGLRAAPNGDLTLTLSADPPANATDAANWVPTPRGAFFTVLRLYSPTRDFIDGKVALQPLVKKPKVVAAAPSPSPAPKPSPAPGGAPAPKPGSRRHRM
ncbi:hypothetical protein HXX76_014806 [Chlamydomonas incerta]|uniref:DUF1254 domain-containing protein n=1 Tax=Chlamydomonas incerta TaxID=51695 RepID=A0A835SBA4_CHLIN|nr:hypothetical protein HXX76_014806 [Chlamydomonas incerta]|eukprot:KAG2424132.1 hypothetical protein HXX76_014806 [Chlamydomonas incerta]